MTGKYGGFTSKQLTGTREKLCNMVYWLLVIADPGTTEDLSHIDVTEAFNNVQNRMLGFGRLMNDPPEVMSVMILLEEALIEYQKPVFDFPAYRKLILDACSEINAMGGDDDADV